MAQSLARAGAAQVETLLLRLDGPQEAAAGGSAALGGWSSLLASGVLVRHPKGARRDADGRPLPPVGSGTAAPEKRDPSSTGRAGAAERADSPLHVVGTLKVETVDHEESRSDCSTVEPESLLARTPLQTPAGPSPLAQRPGALSRPPGGEPQERTAAAGGARLVAPAAAATAAPRAGRAAGAEQPLPSVGSAGHARGSCRPCAFVYRESGCQSGAECSFCHACPPGEKKRRQLARRQPRPGEQ